MTRTDQQNKACQICGETYAKPYKFSRKQWAASRYCSTKCAGEAKIGKKHTDEARTKMSESQKGMKKPWAGKYVRTDEHTTASRKRMYAVHELYGEKTVQAVKDALTGVKRTEEFKANCRNGWKSSDRYKGGKKTFKKRKCHYEQLRRAKLLGAGGSHSQDDWERMKREYQSTCPRCLKSEPEIILTKDHVKPVSKGGSNDISNIQPLCHSCNSKKRAKEVRYARPA